MPDRLHIDFETASQAELKRTGAYAYSVHPSTRVICMSYWSPGGAVKTWLPGDPFPQDVLDHVRRGGEVHGWNVGFEYHIWNNTLVRQAGLDPDVDRLAISQLRDTMAAAAYWGLPLKLDLAGPAAGAGEVKDKEGHALMMRMARPRKIDALTGECTWWHEDDPEKLNRLVEYCEQDVRTEAAISERIPPLPESEQRMWAIDQRINERGVGVDTELVNSLRALADKANEQANIDLARITSGAVQRVTNAKGLTEWLKDNTEYPLDTLRKDDVAVRLRDHDCTGLERQALELRADTAKTSTAKLDTMLEACPTRGGVGRIRGMLQYYGASRTGRWAGRLVQMQNLPRGSIKNVADAIELIEQLGADVEPAEIEALFGPSLEVISSALRGCIVPEPGNALFVADFSQIEARVVAALAGQDDILRVFASGLDVYRYTVAGVKNKDMADTTDHERQLGKVLVLACGFGMSAPKFRDTAEGYGVHLSEAEAQHAVGSWRNQNNKIVRFWWDCDRAAKDVIRRFQDGKPVKPIRVRDVEFAMWRGHMLVKLPSGRVLTYRDARIIKDDQGRDQISYMGINQYNQKWERLRTYGGKLVENFTQAVARDVMAEAIMAADNRGLPITLLVHDEIIGEIGGALGQWALDTLEQIMRTPPKWMPHLPVDCEGWVGTRYRK